MKAYLKGTVVPICGTVVWIQTAIHLKLTIICRKPIYPVFSKITGIFIPKEVVAYDQIVEKAGWF